MVAFDNGTSVVDGHDTPEPIGGSARNEGKYDGDGKGAVRDQACLLAKFSELIDLISVKHSGDDLLLVKCRTCGRRRVGRPGDVAYECTCKGR